jgi:hypothetical protein
MACNPWSSVRQLDPEANKRALPRRRGACRGPARLSSSQPPLPRSRLRLLKPFAGGFLPKPPPLPGVNGVLDNPARRTVEILGKGPPPARYLFGYRYIIGGGCLRSLRHGGQSTARPCRANVRTPRAGGRITERDIYNAARSGPGNRFSPVAKSIPHIAGNVLAKDGYRPVLRSGCRPKLANPCLKPRGFLADYENT